MYTNVKKQLMELKNKKLIAIIDEGRSRKKTVSCMIKNIYNRIFTVEINNVITSFSFSDIICKTIVLKKV